MLSKSIKFRWLSVQCFEVKLTNGKTILTDPIVDLPKNASPKVEKYRIPGFSVDDLTGADYILVNHTHGDHIVNLAEVAHKFNSTVICHEQVAMEIARVCDIPYTKIFPVSWNDTYHFDGFDLATFHGIHRPIPTPPSKMGDITLDSMGKAGYKELDALGSMFSTNFMITTDENLRIGFSAGDYFEDLAKKWEAYRPNVVLRHRLTKDNAVPLFTEVLKRTGAQIMIPMHHEDWNFENPEFVKDIAGKVNEFAREQGISGRMCVLDRTKWYEFSLCLDLAD